MTSINKTFFALLLLFVSSFVSFAQATAPQEKSATVFGAKIHYIEAGDAKNSTVILLHGLGANTDSWQFNVAALAAKYHVVALDQIGFGASDKPLLKYRVGTYTDFLDKFLSELKIEKASLVGNSLGGWIAADFALKYPAKVEKLVLVDAAGFTPAKGLNDNLVYTLNFSTRDEVKTLLKLVFYNQALFGNSIFIDESLKMRVAAGDGYTINSLIDSIKRGEDFLDGRVNAVKQPTLIIWGKQDGLLPLADGERFKREIANSQLIVFDKCGHVPQVEKALDFNSAVLKFLEGK
jgi:2-hydroxy-6-oxonona-2,4-dienedioate hydrolase